jgi:hypothetical protein
LLAAAEVAEEPREMVALAVEAAAAVVAEQEATELVFLGKHLVEEPLLKVS